MQLIQFVLPGIGRRVGVIQQAEVIDLTAGDAECKTVYDLVQQAFASGQKLTDVVSRRVQKGGTKQIPYSSLLAAVPGSQQPYLIAPFDHPDPARTLITGTGLTHTGSVKSRDQMHGGTQSQEPQTDSARMFNMGLQGGRPTEGQRGVSPEWFYKGNGYNLKGHRGTLEMPGFALDGGEEPEIVGCYVVDPEGQPRRVGFVLGNEWSDHATEKINYLYLAPSKLRECSMGPSLQVTDAFDDIALRCTVSRQRNVIYDSGELRSGEKNMCHSLSNMEDHHFKYPQHRVPGDVHLHFFGTSRLSFGSRDWKYEPGDEITITTAGWCEPLTNTVSAGTDKPVEPVQVKSV